MRPNQQNNKNRSRNRNGGRKHVNPLSRNYESTGPDVKVRGNASHIAEKYTQLARDAQSSGDSVMAENYLQHAEHYYRIVMAAQPQPFRQDNGQQESDEDDYAEEADNRFASRTERPNINENDGDGSGDRSPAPVEAQRNEPSRQRSSEPRVSEPRPAEPEAETRAPAPAEAAPSGEEGEGEAPRKRRPRRRRPAAGEAGNDPGSAEQPDVGDLPAFITAGGAAAAE
jgi:hypothetical protein